MGQESDTPLMGSGASRNSCGGCFRDALSPILFQAQFPVARYHTEHALGVATIEEKSASEYFERLAEISGGAA